MLFDFFCERIFLPTDGFSQRHLGPLPKVRSEQCTAYPSKPQQTALSGFMLPEPQDVQEMCKTIGVKDGHDQVMVKQGTAPRIILSKSLRTCKGDSSSSYSAAFDGR